MFLRLLADLVLVAHLGFIVFAALGGLLALRSRGPSAPLRSARSSVINGHDALRLSQRRSKIPAAPMPPPTHIS